MGIDIICNKYIFSCDNKKWDIIKINIINYSFIYLLDIADQQKHDFETTEYNHAKTIINMIKDFEETKHKYPKANYFDIFYIICKNYNYLDSLVYYNMSGLFTLCNKENYGLFSVGNSYDIL